jgi:hypothetical protein
MKITAMTDTSDLRERLNLYSQIVGKEKSEAVKQFARVACVNLATGTQPFGDSKSDKEPGEKAVESDISKVFYTPQDGGFARALKAIVAKSSRRSDESKQKFNARLDGYLASNNTEAISRLARSFNWQGVLFDDIDPQLHQNARRPPRMRVPKRRGEMYMVIGANERLQKYKDEQKRKVGLTKAGWAVCAEKIPLQRASSATRGIPQWVTRHKGRATGSIVDSSHDPNNPSVQMTNQTPWTSQVLSASATKEALRLARDNFIKYMNQQIKVTLREQAKLKAA